MSEIPKRYCVFGCNHLVTFGVPLHRFPHPMRKPELFHAWVSIIGDKLKETDHMKIYKSRRLCDHHFDPRDKISRNRLKLSAIPSVNLHSIQQDCNTFVRADHCYSQPQREINKSIPLKDITNIAGGPRLAIESTDIPVCSGSSKTTCLTENNSKFRTSKFDAENTFEFLQKGTLKGYTRKVRQQQNEVRRLRQKLKSFKLRLRQLKKTSFEKHFEILTHHMSRSAKLFTRMQYMEGQKKKKGHRFTIDEKVLSLSLYKKSPKAYSLMCKYFTLPSRKILKTLLAQVKIYPGINPVIFKELKTTVCKMPLQDRLCTLIFDEMSISPQIFYNPHTDDLVGFENFGKEKTQQFANHALVFMIRGIKKKFKQPVAYYFTQRLSSPRLKEILKEVATNVQGTGLKIVATVCDQGSPNSSCINALICEAKAEYNKAGKEWRNDVIIINNQELIPLFDVPHLIKGIRNNLLNKDVVYKHNNVLKTVKWEYFVTIFAADKAHGELRLLPKLTREHIDRNKIKKMRVKNATQVLSHSMAVAADNLVARGDIPKECLDVIPFVTLMDKLFDSLNASSFTVLQGKKYRAAIKRNSHHHVLWQEALQILSSMQYVTKTDHGATLVKYVPTVNNFIKTIDGFKSLWQLLSKKYALDCMLTRNFNQDPLENFFGSVRSLGARNVAPNCMGFEGAFKTLLLNNMNSNHSVNSNCEKDNSKCLQSLSFFIQNKNKINASLQSQNIVLDQPLDIMQNTSSDFGADQRTYVCGWALTKCLQKIVKGCKQCKSKLLGDPRNAKYRFIQAKEYESNKEWLCYPSDDLVACFHDIQNTTVAFLNSECYKKNIKERIKAFIELFVNFSFMDCEVHKDRLKKCFVDTTINIIIYSWCRTVNRILNGKYNYEGEDIVQKAAQQYYNTNKSIKK